MIDRLSLFKFKRRLSPYSSHQTIATTETPELFFRPGFRAGLSLAITFLNFVLTYQPILLNWTYAYYFLSDLVLTWAIIDFFIRCVHFLDNRLPWTKGIQKRLLVHMVIVTPVVLTFVVFVNELLEVLIPTGRLGIDFYSFDMVVALLFTVILQFLYIALHFIHGGVSKVDSPRQFKVKLGKSTTIVSEPQVLAFFVTSNVTYLLDADCKRYISDGNLKELEEKCSDRFFRANRQFLITKEYVTDYKSLEFGKIEVTLKCQNSLTPEQIIVSRKKAAQFRKWMSD